MRHPKPPHNASITVFSLLVADKVIDDDHSDAVRYAWVSGTDQDHMCEMERLFLAMMDHDVCILPDEYNRAQEWLLSFRKFDEASPLPSFLA